MIDGSKYSEDMVQYLLEPEQEAEARLVQRICLVEAGCCLHVMMQRYAQHQFLDCPYHGTVLFSETQAATIKKPGAPF